MYVFTKDLDALNRYLIDCTAAMPPRVNALSGQLVQDDQIIVWDEPVPYLDGWVARPHPQVTHHFNLVIPTWEEGE